MLRLDWNILFTVINLVILYFLMQRFLFKPINAIIEKRQQEADVRFAEADAREKEARESRTRYEELMQGAQKEKAQIVSEARQEASREYTRIVDEAKGRADGIVEKARTDAEAEKAAILQQADVAVKEMAIVAAARLVAGKENPESDRALYDKFLEQAK